MLTEGGIYLFSLDEEDMPEIPGAFRVDPDFDETVTKMMTGSNRRAGLYPGDRHPTRVESLRFEFDHDKVDGPLRSTLEVLRKKGLFFFAYWLMTAEFYGFADGTYQTFYLPKHRKDAAVLYGKSLDDFPLELAIQGVPQTVVRDKSPAELAAGIAGDAFPDEVWIGNDYDSTGHVPFVIGPWIDNSFVIQLNYYAAHRVIVDSQRPEYPRTQERRTTVLTEE